MRDSRCAGIPLSFGSKAGAMVQTTTTEKRVKIGEYTLTGKIGQGGIAEIFKGRQESLNRDVAIKILSTSLTSDPDIVRRFERESLVIAKLNHPNIVHVIDKGKAGKRCYFVMEYVDGTSLREVIDSVKIPLATKLEMLVQVCKALDYAHKNGVIHRDIKPANILVDRQGNARVADFGIAQIVGTPECEMTSADVVLGTLSYMSPEQKVSSTNVDQTTDLYAVGVILYEILVGKKPLGRFKLPTEFNAELPKAFDVIVSKCLAQEAKDRYQTAVDLKDALLDVTSASQSSRPAEDMSLSGAESFIGRCRYLDTIKETRFGATILVENKVNKQLYILRKHNKGEIGRKEAKLLTSLKHKNIITVYGSGGDAKSTVVISAYAPGGSLADRMARRYDWQQAMKIMADVACGLNFAHKNNIVHGNLRPSNILFDASEEIKLTDFGMPAHYDVAGKKNWYTAPERKSSKGADIYALGVIVHQLVTGRTPEYDTTDNLRLNDVHTRLPEPVAAILRRLLAVRVGQRYSSCEELLVDWENFSKLLREEQMRAALPNADEILPRRRLPSWAFAVAGASLVVIIYIILRLSGALGR